MKDPYRQATIQSQRRGLRAAMEADFDEVFCLGDYHDPCEDYDDPHHLDEEQNRTSSMTVDFFAIAASKQNKKKKARGKNRLTSNGSPQSKPTTATVSKSNKKQTTKNQQVKENEQMTLHHMSSQPRLLLIRSHSFSTERATTKTITMPNLSRSQSFHLTSPCETSKTKAPAVHCMRDLLGASLSIVPAVVGPAPRASLPIVSPRRRAAMVVILCMGSKPRAVPIVGCGETIETKWKAAAEFEARLQEHFLNDLAADLTYTSYWEHALRLSSSKDDLVRLLEEVITPATETDPSGIKSALMDACVKARMHTGKCHDSFDLFQLWLKRMDDDAKANTQEQESTEEDTTKEHTCLVCYDVVTSSRYDVVNQLTPCGHFTCSDCWRSYLGSAASSGQGVVRCSAFKCPTKVGLFDSAHIYFLNGGDDDDDEHDNTNRNVFDRMVRFELEGEIPKLDKETPARFCPTPSCGRVLVSSGVKGSGGRSLLFCDACSSCYCGECKNAGPSHPGMTCTQFQKMQDAIDSGRIDSELESLRWVMQNSRPCPKCNYPIEKNGGCNHVRCQHCEYYFCWQCGGFGNECLAYTCSKSKKSWDHDEAHEEKNPTGLVSLDRHYRAYRQTDARIKALNNTLLKGEIEPKDMTYSLLEFQMLTTLRWMHASDVSKAMKDVKNIENAKKIKQHTMQLRLELALHVLALRRLVGKRRIKHSETVQIKSEEIAKALGITPKKLGKRKQQAKERQHGPGKRYTNEDRWRASKEAEEFSNLFADQELADLLAMPDCQFLSTSRNILRKCVSTFGPSARVEKMPVRSKKSKEKAGNGGQLNEKMKRANVPWKNGPRCDDEDYLEQPNNSDKKAAKSARWKKSKARLSRNRACAMYRGDVFASS